MVVASFQAKIGWKRLRKRGNKNYRSVSFLLDALYRSSKKKFKKLKKYQYSFISSQSMLEKFEKWRK